MKDMQGHARKIRSDAAECLVLSNLVTEERRQLFGRIAEHLNSLALEIETEAVTTSIDKPSAIAKPDQHVDFADRPEPSSDHQRAARSWRLLPWSLLVGFIFVAGAVLWAVDRREPTFANLVSNTGSEFRASAHELATLLWEEKAERKAFNDELSAVVARLDHLAKDLDELKSSRTGIPAPSIKGAFGQEDHSPGMEAKPASAAETGAHAETSDTSSASPTTAAQTTGSTPPTTSAAAEPTDQVGTISATRTESDLLKPTIGPAGCIHFRSFDPVSGTYTTFDGRRRQCR